MRIRWAVVFVVVAVIAVRVPTGAQAPKPAAALPVLVIDTARGVIEIQLFQNDAPKSVAHILGLVNEKFYQGQRFHRVTEALVQIGDPQSRRMPLEAYWGTQNSGSPINVAEISKTRKHVRGSVGLAYSGAPEYADSQFYIMKRDSPPLDGKYAIIGQVTTGMAVVDKIVKADLVKTTVIKATPK